MLREVAANRDTRVYCGQPPLRAKHTTTTGFVGCHSLTRQCRGHVGLADAEIACSRLVPKPFARLAALLPASYLVVGSNWRAFRLSGATCRLSSANFRPADRSFQGEHLRARDAALRCHSPDYCYDSQRPSGSAQCSRSMLLASARSLQTLLQDASGQFRLRSWLRQRRFNLGSALHLTSDVKHR
jgi:hypothetical protein